jgi:hypothetical protein
VSRNYARQEEDTQAPCRTILQGAGCDLIQRRYIFTIDAIKALVGRPRGLRWLARQLSVKPYTLTDILAGKASRRRETIVKRRLGLTAIQDTDADTLAWQIRNRIDIDC